MVKIPDNTQLCKKLVKSPIRYKSSTRQFTSDSFHIVDVTNFEIKTKLPDIVL